MFYTSISLNDLKISWLFENKIVNLKASSSIDFSSTELFATDDDPYASGMISFELHFRYGRKENVANPIFLI